MKGSNKESSFRNSFHHSLLDDYSSLIMYLVGTFWAIEMYNFCTNGFLNKKRSKPEERRTRQLKQEGYIKHKLAGENSHREP